MFIPTPDKNERLLKYALIALGVTLVLAMLSTLFSPMQAPLPSGMGKANQETVLTPETELKLQEQIAPLIKGGDMKACDQVQNDMYKKVCINNIALNKAEETGDISYCRYLDGELIPRDTCERQIIFQKSMENENMAACAEATNESLKKGCEEAFFFGLAQKKSDPKICDQDADTTKADRCWNAYHIQSATAPSPGGEHRSLDCSLLRGDDVKDDCAAIAPALESQDTRKLSEACQTKKSDAFSLVCMMALQRGAPGAVPMMQSR